MNYTGQQIVGILQKRFAEKTAEYFRKSKLDKQITIVDVSYSGLKQNDPNMDKREWKHIIQAFMKQLPRVSNDLNLIVRGMEHEKANSSRNLSNQTALVLDPIYGQYIVGPTFSTTRDNITRILKTLESEYSDISSLMGIDPETGNTVVNIGHIYNKSYTSTKTPLSTSISNLVVGMPEFVKSNIAIFLQTLEDVHTIQTTYSFNRPSVSANKIQKILGTGSVLVTIQSAERNRELAVDEAFLRRQVINLLESESFKNMLINMYGSRTIKEEIKAVIVESVKDGTIKNYQHKPSKSTSSSTKVSSKTNVNIAKLPRLRNKQGRFLSLASLQTLLNQALHEQIRQNMGTGSDKKVLNYRTGRFASSARVEKITQSREGMLTAFYTYMKYPYQTFEPGFKQGVPTSRDPKLLISKSIRDIATTIVGNRMRAVRV